ncbi:DUF4064 domain-containing protein [Listeria ivanovii]|uniref:DUF4064 domain-containing protein n=1 Tax=Listeria ivanovii (strain ATCC BAA-678 / PAM 55) TaxID=881621 RepID=G2ZCZ5_LISIP|nr:DUF4064 domain-containing protein [Listeria ivanovii]AHI55251.1 membrane protein [Listeria ivanovii WSLC3009]AIS64705.1 membrane protein [Listeria ivanovii subsp. ivanovii]MBC1758599.1 DUF4064 domain-containing protein [Listeria ivanovii]MBK3913473.1 DUF4064 domain-containing protein [Listeria ivanovii subsp. ivanovii]MBK3920409.1 DUF4064 domain-containing protein [Listeria ivanovii subsp. ivanovii]
MNFRKPEFILTLIAGITGVIAGITGIIGGGIMSALLDSPEVVSEAGIYGSEAEKLANASGMVVVLAVFALVIGIALFVFAFLIKKNVKVFGILTLVLGVAGFFLIQFLWVVPGILAIIAGIMCLARKDPAAF